MPCRQPYLLGHLYMPGPRLHCYGTGTVQRVAYSCSLGRGERHFTVSGWHHSLGPHVLTPKPPSPSICPDPLIRMWFVRCRLGFRRTRQEEYLRVLFLFL